MITLAAVTDPDHLKKAGLPATYLGKNTSDTQLTHWTLSLSQFYLQTGNCANHCLIKTWWQGAQVTQG